MLATARYSTGWPARFHVVPPWTVDVDIADGLRRYSIGAGDVTDGDLLHIRYQSSVDDAHGHGPLEAGGARMTAAEVLTRYATNLAAGGGIPPSVLEHPDELAADQSADLKAQWVPARLSSIGEPAVLVGRRQLEADAAQPEGHGAGRAAAVQREHGSRSCSACRRSWSGCRPAATR